MWQLSLALLSATHAARRVMDVERPVSHARDVVEKVEKIEEKAVVEAEEWHEDAKAEFEIVSDRPWTPGSSAAPFCLTQ
jgi:hypothetical protein